jgi:nitrate reductase NapE component
MNWELLWKAVLILTLCGYSLLAVIVIIGGVGNIIDMLRDLRKPVDSSEE